MTPLKIGQRVRVLSSERTAAFLHGVEGEIVETPSVHSDGKRLMRFDEPVRMPHSGYMSALWVDEETVEVLQ